MSSIYDLPPFERAVCCIKYYEGMHRKKDYPYVGYGHKLRPGETYSSNMSLKTADALLRRDLQSLCAMFSKYGKDSLLLAALAYNVGPGKVLGCEISRKITSSSAIGRGKKYRLSNEDGMLSCCYSIWNDLKGHP